MKSKITDNNIKKFRISAVCLCLLFVLTTLVGIFAFPVKARAAATADDHVLKFKQVAAGEDFAIALTYDNYLYGWSLQKEERQNFENLNTLPQTATLGDYYPTTPSRIDVAFYEITASGDSYQIGYNGRTETDEIVQIAASRTTAAFVTGKGYVYIWGKEIQEPSRAGNVDSNLLLRHLTLTTSGSYFDGSASEPHNLLPAPINYANASVGEMHPGKNGGVSSVNKPQLSGGDANYSLYFTSGSTNYVWGQSVYGLLHSSEFSYENLPIVTKYADTNRYYMGDGNIFYVNNEYLNVRGKNHTVKTGASVTVTDGKVASGTGISGGVFSASGDDGGTFVTSTAFTDNGANDNVYPIKNAVTQNQTANNAYTYADKKLALHEYTPEFTYSDGQNSFDGMMMPAITAGAGYVYALSNDGLVVKGDASDNRGLITSGTYDQAVAGKILAGDPIMEVRVSRNALGNIAKWEQNGDTYTLKSEYVDGTTYISAVLKDGAVTVFGHIGNTGLAATNITGDLLANCGVNNNNKIVAMYPGYANNLFLLSNLGKMYRVTTDDNNQLTCVAYDLFRDASGNAINNWTVNSAATMRFTGDMRSNDGYYDVTRKESRASATVSLNGITENKRVIAEDGGVTYEPAEENDTKYLTTSNDKDIIASDRAGDAYRIMVPKNIGKGDDFSFDAADTKWTNVSQTAQSYNDVGELKFYWNSSTNEPMPTAVAFRYFKIAFKVNNDTNDVSFTVTPKQSTGGRQIVIRYWVGRYDATANFGIGNSSAGFYDFKPVEVKVEIGNTFFTPEFTSAYENGVPSLPLLDPNNPNNRYYSVAAMHVSQGMRDLAAKLEGYKDEDLIGLMAKADDGFPSDAKKDANDYYGQNAYYDNEYRYFVSDHDGDVIAFSSFGAGAVMVGNKYQEYSTNYYKYTVAKPEIELDLSGISDSTTIKTLCDLFGSTKGNTQVPQFENRYGLTITLHGEEADEDGYYSTLTKLVVSYEVLRIEATASMPDVVGYVSTLDGMQTTDISKPQFKLTPNGSETRDSSATNLRTALISVTFGDVRGGDSQVLRNNNSPVNRCVEVFTQSSLTLKDDASISGAADDDHKTFDVPARELKLGENRSWNVDLSSYFNDVSNITVSYLPADKKAGTGEGEYNPIGQTAWNDFASSFGGSSAPFGMQVNGLDTIATSFTLTVHGKVENYQFYVQLRRLQPDGRSLLPETEVIYLHYTVTVTFDKDNLLGVTGNRVPESYPVTQKSDGSSYRVDIMERMKTEARFLQDFCTIEVYSSAPSVARASVAADNRFIELTPVSNGLAWIKYTVRVKGAPDYEFTDSFQVQVSAIVSRVGKNGSPKVEYVSSTSYISVSEMKGDIVKANSVGNTITSDLELRKGDNGKAFYFQTSSETGKSDAETAWSEPLDSLPFLRNVDFDSLEQSLVLHIASFDVASVAATSRIVVMFQGGGSNYELSIRVAPAAQTLMGLDQSELVLEINKDAATIGIVNAGEYGDDVRGILSLGNDKFAVPLSFLRSRMANNSTGDAYEILVVNTRSFDGTENYGKYLDASVEGENLILTPRYPTAALDSDYCNVQVSIHNTTLDTVTVLNFAVRVNGIKTVLPASDYRTIVMAVFFSVLVLLLIIFFIRLGIFWRKKADQRRIIKKNQMLIKMRDKMHNKTEAVKKEDLVRTKLKMEDPKYAKVFTEMRKEKEAATGISLENSVVADKAARKAKAAKASKKRKGGKKSIEELQAELLAKREAVARMQMGDFSDVPNMEPEGAGVTESIPVQSVPVEEEQPQPVFDPDAGFEGMTAEQLDEQFRAAMGEEIMFDPVDNENNNENQG